MKRWTLNARDVLPPHLEHYQKEKAALHSQTLRHSRLYLTALEVVNLGDSNVNAYEVAMKHLLQVKTELEELRAEKDGLSLTDQLYIQNQAVQGGNEYAVGMDGLEVVQAEGNSLNVLPPERTKKRGRPSNTRDKPPYEHGYKRSKYYVQQAAGQQPTDNNTAEQTNSKRTDNNTAEQQSMCFGLGSITIGSV